MEAHGSPGSIGAADIPVPDDAGLGGQADDLGMTPTTDILTQLVYNNRVTTNAISQLATHSGSTGVPNSYEGTLSKALEGAVKMLGRPPTFGGGKTEVHDFLDFKEQLYNILAYAEPRIWNVVKHLEFAKDVELLLNPRKPFDKEAIEDAVRRENEWIQFHIDEEEKKKKKREVDQVRMVREEFHDVAKWYLMDATDDDSDWLIVGEQDSVNSIRAIQLEETVPEEDWNSSFRIQVPMRVCCLVLTRRQRV
eukprot:s5040_g12.t1